MGLFAKLLKFQQIDICHQAQHKTVEFVNRKMHFLYSQSAQQLKRGKTKPKKLENIEREILQKINKNLQQNQSIGIQFTTEVSTKFEFSKEQAVAPTSEITQGQLVSFADFLWEIA